MFLFVATATPYIGCFAIFVIKIQISSIIFVNLKRRNDAKEAEMINYVKQKIQVSSMIYILLGHEYRAS